jgi:hypothetical protein
MASRTRALVAAALLALLGTSAVHATPSTKCKMNFTLKGWSAIYKTAKGTGVIKCSNGQTATVKLSTKGGGLTFGKSSIDNGIGEFSSVPDMEELFGSYAAAEAHAGAMKSAQGQVMTKGEVSLAWRGTGRGWDLGIAIGKLTISR